MHQNDKLGISEIKVLKAEKRPIQYCGITSIKQTDKIYYLQLLFYSIVKIICGCWGLCLDLSLDSACMSCFGTWVETLKTYLWLAKRLLCLSTCANMPLWIFTYRWWTRFQRISTDKLYENKWDCVGALPGFSVVLFFEVLLDRDGHKLEKTNKLQDTPF